VEEVEDIHPKSVYARKILRNVHARNIKEAKRQLQNEAQIMKRLESHHYIVRVHAIYIVVRELASIIDPLADGGDLARFLQRYQDYDRPGRPALPDTAILQESFGCFASGLAFIHRQKIRHKDIKPQNILIHRGEVMYTKFGLSYNFADDGRSMTTGFVSGLTKRYCASEAAEGASRNSKSDVFSLGCVYVEIMDALYLGYVNERLLVGPFHKKLKSLSNHDIPTWHKVPRVIVEEKPIIEGMLSADPLQRPSASWVVRKFSTIAIGKFFCQTCYAYRYKGTSFASFGLAFTNLWVDSTGAIIVSDVAPQVPASDVNGDVRTDTVLDNADQQHKNFPIGKFVENKPKQDGYVSPPASSSGLLAEFPTGRS
jgi:serine/threonine protein kinase